MRSPEHFNLLARLLHWSMAAAILTMLFVGIGMVVSIEARPWLLALHRPLGIAILLLALVRLANRWLSKTPELPPDLPALQVFTAKASHALLYLLMIAMPLIGWAMQSAGGYPIVLFPGFELPPLMSADSYWYTRLRGAHTVFALVLFATMLLHLAAALYHAWVRRDGVFPSMARGD